MTKKIHYLLPFVAFVVMTCYILLGFYQDMLFTAQLRTPFLEGATFFQSMLVEPMGLLSYAGCYLTQHLYHPMLGTLLLLLLWLVAYVLGIRAFRLRAELASLMLLPLGCMLLSLTDVGYWIYTMKMQGYWFSQSLGLVLMLLMLASLLRLARLPWLGRLHWLVDALVCVALYPVLGWWSYLLALCLLVVNRSYAAPLVLLAPALWHNLGYEGVSAYKMWLAGFPVFENNAIIYPRPMLPFLLLAVFIFAVAVLSVADRRKPLLKQGVRWLRLPLSAWLGLAMTVLTFAGVWQLSFKNSNYLAEMRMTRAAMADDWEQVIREVRRNPYPSRTMVMLKNLALMNQGDLGSQGFALSSDGLDIYNPDQLNVNIMQIASPVIYYHYGMANYATRWCIENAVGYGFSPYHLMMLARCADTMGEQRLARRYTDLLHGMHYYRDWEPSPASSLEKGLMKSFGNVIDSDNNSCERYMIEFFSSANGLKNPVVRELNLFYSMLYGDPSCFWPALVSYASQQPEQLLSVHYQEAYFHFMEHYPAELPFKVKVSNEVVSRYKVFRSQVEDLRQKGVSKELIGAYLRKNWGGTYWWFAYFGRTTY